jgi:hypothetical protein
MLTCYKRELSYPSITIIIIYPPQLHNIYIYIQEQRKKKDTKWTSSKNTAT